MPTNIPRARVSRRLSRPLLPARRLCHKAHCACGRRVYASHAPSPRVRVAGACGAVAPRPSRGRRTIRSYGIGARPRRARTVLRGRTLRRPRTANPENPQRSPAVCAPAPLIHPPLRHGPPIPGGGRGGRAPRRLGAPPTARFALQGPRPSAVAGSLEGGLRARTRRARPSRWSGAVTPPAPRSAR